MRTQGEISIGARQCQEAAKKKMRYDDNWIASMRYRVSQGLCATTLTERFANPTCRCDTYSGNLGPCATFEEGTRVGYCVYCNHEQGCHDEIGLIRGPVKKKK